MAATVSSLLDARIFKKTDTDAYQLYHPETVDGQIYVYLAAADTSLGISTYYKLASATVASSSSWSANNYCYVKLSDMLGYMNQQIGNFGSVLEFVGSGSTISGSIAGRDVTALKGEVYLINTAITTGACTWTQSLGGGTTYLCSIVPANDYPSSTLYVASEVISATNTHSVVFTPLGGSNSVYALKKDAVNVNGITADSSGLHFTSIDGNTTRTVGGTIATTTASSIAISTATITSSSTNSEIPTSKAVWESIESATPNLTAGDGVTVTTTNNITTVSATANTNAGITVTSSGIGLKTTGITSGVYSALQVDAYGRANAGGQSVIFADNINDPDLSTLVIGGLAFVGAAATSTNGAATTSGTFTQGIDS